MVIMVSSNIHTSDEFYSLDMPISLFVRMAQEELYEGFSPIAVFQCHGKGFACRQKMFCFNQAYDAFCETDVNVKKST